MNGQPSPNQGGIAQLAGGMGGMGGNPTLGGAPQTPPMPQGGAQKPPQQAPQGGLPPDLLKALAAAKVKKMQDAAKRELELQMAQQQAASGEGNKTVVQQLQEGVEKNTAQEMMQALSGGLKQAGQMSAQAQGQPMSGGIAAAPGANQAAQPEAMAAGGIVAFDEGGMARGAESLYVDSLGNAMTREEAERAGKPKLLRDLSGADYYVDEDGNVRSKAETKERFNPKNRNLPVVVDQPLERNLPSTDVRREIKDVGSSSTARNIAPTQSGLGSIKTGLSKAAKLAVSPYVLGAELMTESKEAGAGSDYKNGRPITPDAVRKLRKSGYFEEKGIGALNPFRKSPDEKEREMLRSAAPDVVGPNITPEQLAANSRQRQNVPAATLQSPSGPRIDAPTGAPRPAATLQAPTAPAPDAFQQSVQAGITGLMNTDATAEATKARDEYNRLVAVDPEMAAQLKADNARVRATAERKGATPTWQESLYAAMPKGRPQPGSSIFTTIGDAVGGINALELQRKNEKETAEKELLGMSRADYDRDIARKERIYGAGSEAAKAAKAAREKAIQSGTIMAGNQTQEKTAYAQMANELVARGMSNASAEKIAGMNAAASAAATAATRESNTLSRQQTILSSLQNTRETVRKNIAAEFIPRYNLVNPLLTGEPDSATYKKAMADKQRIDKERDEALKIATTGLDSQIEEIHSQIGGGTSGFKVVGKRQQ